MIDLSKKRVLVTGGSGFLGRHVLEQLRRRGIQEPIAPRSSEYNLVDNHAVKRMLQEQRPDVVIHLAAKVGGIGANRLNPGSFFYENLMMGVQLLEQARLAKVEKTVVIGTVCAYPKFTPVPFKEDDLWNGYPEETNAPYGIAKKALLVQSQSYRTQYGMNSIFLLPVNLYGSHDNFDLESSHVIPALIRKMVEAQKASLPTVTLWGDGTPTREFLHARDAAEGIVLATERYDGDAPVNIGTGEEFTIRALAEMIASEVGFHGEIIWDSTKPNGQPRRKLDTSRAEAVFGFRARVPFVEGIRETVQWYRETVGGL